MSTSNKSNPGNRRYVDEQWLEDETGRSKKSWQRDRLKGSGPKFIRCGGKILYDLEDFHAWMASNKHISTSSYVVEA